MSHDVTQAILDGPQSLKKGPLQVLNALGEWAHKNGHVEARFVRCVLADGSTRTGLLAIAERARLEERQVRRVIAKLKERGFLTVIPGKGPGMGNSYRIMLDVLRKAAVEELEAKRQADEQKRQAKENRTFSRRKVAGKPDIFDSNEGRIPDIFDGKNSENVRFKSDIHMSNHPSDPSLTSLENPVGEESRLSRAIPTLPGSPLRSVDKRFSARRPAFVANGAHSPPAVATRLPPDFALTKERQSWGEAQLREHGVKLDIRLAFKKFRNHFLRGNGRETELDDWEGRWERWLLDDIEKLTRAAEANGKGHRESNAPANRRRNGSGSREHAQPGIREDTDGETVSRDRSQSVGGLRVERLST